MRDSRIRKHVWIARFAAFAFFLTIPLPNLHAQAPGSPGGQMGEGVGNQTTMGNMGGGLNDQLQFGTFGTNVERDQDHAYQAFLKEREPEKKIRLGNDFLKKYPKSPLVELIDVGMMNAYDQQQDWKNTYLWADNALALQPDDVEVLTTVGWTIPHVYTPNDDNADAELDKAEKYSKHALDVLNTIKRPAGMNDAQFAAAKAKRSFQAHSALGLVYFRRDDYEKSAEELALATNGNPVQDQTDLYVLGIDLQNLKRYGEASDAFRACGQVAGALQDQCKQSATSTKALADLAKIK